MIIEQQNKNGVLDGGCVNARLYIDIYNIIL